MKEVIADPRDGERLIIGTCEKPDRMEQTDRLGLVDYLPSDVNAIGYVPRGMESTVENLRNRDLKQRMGHHHRRNFGK